MFWLDQKDIDFPPVELAHPSGILAFGGDLRSDRLINAYTQGIFPWYEDGEEITWWAPEERMVVFPQTYVPRKSLRQIIRKSNFIITQNQAFVQVISNCQNVPRDGQRGTWITDEMKEAYINLHHLGKARSIEVWEDENLVGGLYGVDLKGVFCGESMFSLVSNASKVAFVWLIQQLKTEGYNLLDCQVYNTYLNYLGATLIPRSDYMEELKKNIFSIV
jgi:leucyl/phenylalanyl-tRNA--protein transferase